MPLLTFALAVMALAQFLDLATFTVMVTRLGPQAEANPIVAQVLATHGVALLALGKGAVVVLVAATAVVLAEHRASRVNRWIAAGVIATAIVVGIIGGWSNSLTIGPF